MYLVIRILSICLCLVVPLAIKAKVAKLEAREKVWNWPDGKSPL